MPRITASIPLVLTLLAACSRDSAIESFPGAVESNIQMSSTPYESEMWDRYDAIVVGQGKKGRAALVIDHLIGEPDLLDHIRPSDRAVFLCVAMDGEICNGGIKQWFTNFTGTYRQETILELDQLGAHDVADLLRKAANEFPDGQPHEDLDARHGQYVALGDAGDERFNQYDDEYWPLRNDLYERLHRLDTNTSNSEP